MADRIDWNAVAIVEVILPTCPNCNAVAYVPIKGWRDADGGRTSRRICRDCGGPYTVLSLPPELGVSENEVDIFPAHSKGTR